MSYEITDESTLVAASDPAGRSGFYKTDRSYVDPQRAGTGITAELGMLFGGDDLATATFTNGENSSLPAGSGMSLSLGAQWTPLWIGNAVGIGLGGSLGYKENSINASNGSVTLSRYPLVAALHAIIGRSRSASQVPWPFATRTCAIPSRAQAFRPTASASYGRSISFFEQSSNSSATWR